MLVNDDDTCVLNEINNERCGVNASALYTLRVSEQAIKNNKSEISKNKNMN